MPILLHVSIMTTVVHILDIIDRFGPEPFTNSSTHQSITPSERDTAGGRAIQDHQQRLPLHRRPRVDGPPASAIARVHGACCFVPLFTLCCSAPLITLCCSVHLFILCCSVPLCTLCCFVSLCTVCTQMDGAQPLNPGNCSPTTGYCGN